jgi:hypothetical protein
VKSDNDHSLKAVVCARTRADIRTRAYSRSCLTNQFVLHNQLVAHDLYMLGSDQPQALLKFSKHSQPYICATLHVIKAL